MTRNEDKQAHPMSGVSDWISLAAAPTFAIMALLTGTFRWRTDGYALLCRT